ncbi:RNA polymerase sigma factor [Chryseosolibacter indicus]|uniref:Sigma-70 family RNA polymerase sigma factor n=1 Tax=Chryseosolibacter indicus TaxID=2782351 RepID=A0ABS5VVW3_9BACT|nr:sigma-70 family RNA polymerase sigma factor [Chryseosolibacter indicus]MBT1705573.1 sigma-70 family RNA polymerase sigma factor [Chryseosolibacter indicus]
MSSKDNYKNLTDEALIGLYKKSEELTIVGELYSRYTALVYGVCLKYLKNREESKDAVMHIFEKLIISLKEHDINVFKPWLYVTARNHCLMQLRAMKGKTFEELSPFLMEFGGNGHQEQGPEVEGNIGKLEKCIQELSHEQKQCVKLFYMEQKCYKEITEDTGYDLNKVKSYIQNGKRNLKICMERNGKSE